MGIFDAFRRKRPIDPALVRAVEDYKRDLKTGEEEAGEFWQALFEGLSDREICLIEAAEVGLAEVPGHLASRLELYSSRLLEMERREVEAGLIVDNSMTATRLLARQPWWPEFITNIRQGLSVRTAADIGRWSTHGKRIAPYVWECGFVFQTREAAAKDGPVSVWSWRVDLKKGTSESV